MKEWLIRLGKIIFYGLIWNGEQHNYTDTTFYNFGLTMFIIFCVCCLALIVLIPITIKIERTK